MNIKNFSTLTFVIIGMCLLLPTLAEFVDSKVYVIRGLKNAKIDDTLWGVEIARNEEGEEISTVIFGITPEGLEAVVKSYVEADGTFEEVTIDKLPVAGLITILKHRPELYSEGLPSLLARTSPKKVAETLPGDRLATLTPEAKSLIGKKDLAELEKLYRL